jgi:hypothetical protein
MPAAAWAALVFLLVSAGIIAACDLAFPIHADGLPDAGTGDAGTGDAGTVPEASCFYDGAVQNYPAEVMKDGPVLYLRLDESAGAAVARDQTANHYDGAYTDGGLQFGVPGAILGDPDTAVHFDGMGSIAMPPGFDFAGLRPFTVETWAILDPGNEYGWVADHSYWGDEAGVRQSWNFYLYDGVNGGVTLERRESDGENHGSVVAGALFPLDSTFHHAVATFDGMNIVIYFDGKKVANTTAAGNDIPGTNGNGWTIGAQNCACSGHTLATLDEVAVYPVGLSADRVCAHYLASGRH